MTATLADAIRAYGVDLVEVPGWKGRGRPYSTGWLGVIGHHDAIQGTSHDRRITAVRDGRRTLPGPLYNVHVHFDGRAALIADGYTNNAGYGNQSVLDRMRRGLAPEKRATSRGTTIGNRWFFAVCLSGGYDPFTDVQLGAFARVVAAAQDYYGWSTEMYVDHKEWTKRKIDPGYGVDLFPSGNEIRYMVQVAKDEKDRAKELPRTTPDEYDPPWFVTPLGTPIVGSMACPTGGVWLLGADGAVFALEGAPYRGGANQETMREHFVDQGRRAAALVEPTGVERADAGYEYVIVDTTGARYGFPQRA